MGRCLVKQSDVSLEKARNGLVRAGRTRIVKQHAWDKGQPSHLPMASPRECSATLLSPSFSGTPTSLSHALITLQEGPDSIRSDHQSYQLLRTAIAKYHRLGASDNGNLFPQGSGDWKSKTKVLAGLVSFETSLWPSGGHHVLTWVFLGMFVICVLISSF